MNQTQRIVLVLGIVAALGQLAVPPHTVRVTDMLGEKSATITRWYPISGAPQDIVWLRGGEAWDGDLDVAFPRAHGIASDVLMIQLAATALIAGLIALLAASPPKRAPPSDVASEGDDGK